MLRSLTMSVVAGLLLSLSAAVAQNAPEEPSPLPTLALSASPPPGAVVLMSDDPASMGANWVRRGTEEAAGWTMTDGAFDPTDKSDITSRQSFSDGIYHVEFRCPVDAEGKPVTHGNAGIGIMGRYEIQMMNSYGVELSNTDCGSFFSQTAAERNACKPAGEWQSFDIIFRAPRLDAEGKVVEPARATVFQNGVLVQNNAQFNGPTGIQYGDFQGEVASAPIVLQGNHDPVSMRNLWVLPY